MGWGICFALDDHDRVYCADGCKWRATESDYDDFPSWPSARRAVLDYFEGPGHSELDMIRDEFPGTADGLAAACPDAMGSALHYYDSMTDAEKTDLHNEALAEFESQAERTQNIWDEAKASVPPAPKEKKCRSKIDQIQNKIEILQHELVVENLRQLKNELNRAKRLVKLEKTFKL
jgi:hypothetical protein